MTLYRQLLIFSLLLFTLLFAGTWLVKFGSTRTFLSNQLQSHARDTATALGLSVSPYVGQGDLPAIETMVNAVFDSGYYRLIRIADMNDTVILERSMAVVAVPVPQWFVQLVPVKAPSATAMIMEGWNQAGQVTVESYPGFAYLTLWETGVRTAAVFLIVGTIVLVAGGLGLRVLLAPLKEVERQAEMLSKGQYVSQEKLPRTVELRQVVEAMNRMTFMVREMFDEQVRIAEQLRSKVYVDSLTGLGNRRYLKGQVSTRLDRGGSHVKGSFLLVQVKDLLEINKQMGFQAGDALLQEIGNQLMIVTDHVTHKAIARLTGGDFGLFLPDVDPEGSQQIVKSLTAGFTQLAVEGRTLSDNIGHVGGVTFNQVTDFNQLLAGADTALRRAQHTGPNSWHLDSLAEMTSGSIRGEKDWENILARALAEKQIHLYGQKCVYSADKSQVLQLEIFSRIMDESGNLLSAGLFIPMAERLGMVALLDRVVLEKVMQTDFTGLGVDQVAVNVSPSSLNDGEFQQWVLKALETLPTTAPRLCLEFAEFGAVQNLKRVKEFGARLHELGHGYGLDHFGQGFVNFGYLQFLRPDYVKIDRAYTDEMKSRESNNYFFIGSLTGVAHRLDIQVIAEGVETEEQAALLDELRLEAIQGYYVGIPASVGSENPES